VAVRNRDADLPEGVRLAPGELVIGAGGFSFSTLLFFLHWDMAVTSKRLVGRTPNTVAGVVPLGSTSVSYPLANIAGVVTRTRFSLLWFVVGLLFVLGGMGGRNIFAIVIGLLAIAASYNAQIFITNTGGGHIAHNVAFFDRGRANSFVREVNAAIATYAHQIPGPNVSSVGPAPPSAADRFDELVRLRKAGHLTQEEYEAKRRDLVDRL
jgi:hypothetical protein